MPSIPREKYPEMNWRAADKVAAWKVFKRRMEVIFVADQIPEERQWALILVAGGDEAYNRWDTLEDTVTDRKVVKQVWDAFEKSFEQSTSFWHFRDTYLADFRQDESETMADLDLRIKQTVKGCQWEREQEEGRMIDLLYHATIYYEIRKFVQEADPTALTYEMVIEKAKAHERNVLEYKDHQASHGGANSAPSYNNPLLSAHALSKRRPSGRGNNGQRCGKCGKSHERGNCPAYGKTCNRCQGINHFKAVCRSKVAAKTGQSPHEARSHSRLDVVPRGATIAPERTEVDHTGGTSRGVSKPSTRRPSLSKQGTGKCQTTHVLDRNRCGHRRLHQEMPGMHQKVSSTQGASLASWHTRGPLEETRNGLFQLWWQFICLDLWLFLEISLPLQSQNIILVIKGPSNRSLFNWRVSRRDSIRQWTTIPEQGVCQISLQLRHQAHHFITRVSPL